MENTQPGATDPAKLDALVTRAVADISACYGGVMISLGNRLGRGFFDDSAAGVAAGQFPPS